MTAPSQKKFDEDRRATYLDSIRKGNLKFESARLVGVSYRTVQRYRNDDDGFRLEEEHAMSEAREGIEKVLYDMAMQGDISAIKMWLTSHDRSTYGDKQVIEIDATQAAVTMSANDALAAVANLQVELAERHARLLETGDIEPVKALDVIDVADGDHWEI